MRKFLLAALVIWASLVGAQSIPTTPNINLYVPYHGTPNWDTYMNADMNFLDSFLSGGTPLNLFKVNQYIDFSAIAAPTPPSSPFCRFYYDIGLGQMTGINSLGAPCSSSGGGGGGSGSVVAPGGAGTPLAYFPDGTAASVTGDGFTSDDGAGNVTVNSLATAGAGGIGLLITPSFQIVPAAFSTLLTCNSSLEGYLATVTDSTTNIIGATITGFGSFHVVGYCDGTNWTVGTGATLADVLLAPTGLQTITENIANGFAWEQTPCTSLDVTSQDNAGCGATYHRIVLRSLASTQNNLRKGLNIYSQQNMQQGGGAEYFGLQVVTNALLDANSVSSGTLIGIGADTYTTNNNVTIPEVVGIQSRLRFNANPTITTVEAFKLPAVLGSGTANITNYCGICFDGFGVGSGNPTNSVWGSNTSTGTGWKYGLLMHGSVQANVADDTVPNASGYCHGITGAYTATVHDCLLGGTGSPETIVTANIGSIFARQDGSAGTSLYIKESGSGNTGWKPVFTGSTSSNCAAVGTSANPSVASCSAAPAGSFSCAVAASTGTCVVNTTAVTANSEIFIQQRSDTVTGTRLSVTCNTGVSTVLPDITAVSAGVSFTVNLGTVAVNPECFSYNIVN